MSASLSPFGLPFFEGSKIEVRRKIMDLANLKKGASVLFVNAHVVVEAHENRDFLKELNKADLVVPDGVPITWVMKSIGYYKAERYSGPDLMEDLFYETKNARHFFLGSTLAVLEKIKGKFPGHAVGFYAPPFSPSFTKDEKAKQLKMIEDAKADYIWVGLGAPKQEKYVIEMSRASGKGVWLAVGAAFDFYAGTKPRAPKHMQRIGMEWAYRMFTEPRRLAIRYAKTNPKFIRLALGEVAQFSRKGKFRDK